MRNITQQQLEEDRELRREEMNKEMMMRREELDYEAQLIWEEMLRLLVRKFDLFQQIFCNDDLQILLLCKQLLQSAFDITNITRGALSIFITATN